MSTFKMGFKNIFVLTALFLIWKVCRVCGQTARVEYVNQPCSSSVATTFQATPQIVVPACIKPCVSPYDSYIQESVPTVPSYNGYNGYSGYTPNYAPQPMPPMPPIIIDDDDDDNWHHLLYFLIFAMRNKRNCGSGNYGGCGGSYNGGCGCGGGCNGGCGGGYNGGCGCGGGCNGGCGCGYNGGGGCNGGCGGYNGGYNGGCGCGGGYDCCGCGNFGGYSNNFGSCSSFIPYPIPVPMNGAYPYSFSGLGGFPDNSCGGVEDTCQPCSGSHEINVIIRADPSCTC